ncbi:hypothetical protein GCM10017608_05620 [Agromyces luteolus]|uniref:Uncharacterized protein n=1 Tax=Agromyces luteolus TaxID=88373 RepID=A0A7C9LWN1_9MICO|nr:hypothetical protein [Agromyces luteolus]MUN06337.1 hypothetical protein [Agromyces luteolus]GLK26630.1 hypothetical protein GCM10017608_05620 [Agromyces luteolus]
MQRRITVATVAALLGAAVIAPAPAFAAGPPEVDHFVETESHIEQEAHGPDWCGGAVAFDVLWDRRTEGTFVGRTRGNGLSYGLANFRSVEVYTNVENGKTYTIQFRGGDRESSIVDNGDGTLTLTVTVTGSTQYTGPDGRRVFLDAGAFSFSFLIDHNGTPGDPSDDLELEFLGIDGPHGRFDTWDRDLCADIATLLG